MAAIFHDKYEFHDLESLVTFLKERDEGEFFTEFPGVKIKYNANTGEVYPVGIREKEDIEISYSQSLFPNLITLVSDAICLLAKHDLLLHLMGLGDISIAVIIRKKHIDMRSGGFIRLNPFTVDMTLLQVIAHCGPSQSFLGIVTFKSQPKTTIQKAVYEVLTHPDYTIDRIDSRGVVLKVMGEIKKKLG